MDLFGTLFTILCWIGGILGTFILVGVPLIIWFNEDVLKKNKVPGPNDGIRPVSGYKGRLGKMKHFRIQPIFDGEGQFIHFRVEIMCDGWDRPCQFVTDGEGLEDIEETVKKVRGIKLAADAMGELD